MEELYRPPKRKADTLRQTALHTAVRNAIKTGQFPSTDLPPTIGDQVQRQLKRYRKRSVKQAKLYQNYISDIDYYFENKHNNVVPFYILGAFSRLVDAEMNNDLLESFRLSNRKFQKVGTFDPSDFEEGTGKYTYYFVKYRPSIFLSVYDYEKQILLAMCIS